jgi:hypothetical protein
MAALALMGAGAVGAPPALEPVSTTELGSPLAVELLVPPALLDNGGSFDRLMRDPRFPSVLMRRQGAVFAAFRRSRPLGEPGLPQQPPSDVVYFIGRPGVEEIRRIWPDAVVEETPERGIDAETTPTVVRQGGDDVMTPRMAHGPTRARRLEAIARRYAPSG